MTDTHGHSTGTRDRGHTPVLRTHVATHSLVLDQNSQVPDAGLAQVAHTGSCTHVWYVRESLGGGGCPMTGVFGDSRAASDRAESERGRQKPWAQERCALQAAHSPRIDEQARRPPPTSRRATRRCEPTGRRPSRRRSPLAHAKLHMGARRPPSTARAASAAQAEALHRRGELVPRPPDHLAIAS